MENPDPSPLPLPPISKMEKWPVFALRSASSLIWQWGGGGGYGGLKFHFILSKIVGCTVLNYNYLQAPFLESPGNYVARKAKLFAFKIVFYVALRIVQLGNKQKQVIFSFNPETLPRLSRNPPEVPVVQNSHLLKQERTELYYVTMKALDKSIHELQRHSFFYFFF